MSDRSEKLLAEELSTERLPERIGSYVVHELLGRTATGPVYRVSHPGMGEQLSLKLLPAEELATNEVARRQLPKMTQLRHDGIARVYEVEIDSPEPHIVTEFVEGTTLREKMAQGRLPFAEAFRIFRAMCAALDAAHGFGVLHRGLTPNTVMVSDDLSEVRVIDFGIGALGGGRVDVRSAGTHQVAGLDLHYRAPETLREGIGRSGARGDVYSAGVIFYELLTGQRPSGKLSLPSQRNSEVPSDVDPVVLQALAKDPQDRYGGFGDLLRDLRALEDRHRLALARNLEDLSRTTSKLLVSGSGRWRLPPAAWVALALMLLALGLLGFGALRSSSSREGGPQPSSPLPEQPVVEVEGSAPPEEVSDDGSAADSPPPEID